MKFAILLANFGHRRPVGTSPDSLPPGMKLRVDEHGNPGIKDMNFSARAAACFMLHSSNALQLNDMCNKVIIPSCSKPLMPYQVFLIEGVGESTQVLSRYSPIRGGEPIAMGWIPST